MDKKIEKRQSLQFKMKPLSLEKMGEKLVRVSCYLLATGINRNGSNITKDAIIKANEKLAHLPVVGHLMQTEDGSWYLGGHDYSIEVQPEVEFKPLTVPLGCIAGDKKFEFEKITEEDTGITREYLKVDMIIWNHLSPVMEAAFSSEVFFNESIEIDEVDGIWDETNNFRIEYFVYDRACLLGLDSDKHSVKHTEPCFPECKVYPVEYSKDSDFNKQFALLMSEIKAFNSSSQEEPPSQEIPQQELDDLNINNQKKEDENLSKEIKFSDICEKIKAIISENTYSSNGKKYEKYHVCAIHEDSKFVDVVDREDNYSVYKIPYVATQTEEDLLVSLDFDNKVEKSFIIADKTETVFNIRSELDLVSNDFAAYTLETSKDVQKLRDDFAAISSKYEAAQEEITNLKKHLEVYESEKRQLMEKQHRDTIDNIIESKKDEMGRFSEYLEYCLNDHYKKTIDEVKTELKEIHYNFMQKKLGNKKSFSVIETNVVNSTPEDDSLIARWGEENAKYLK